jgi:hypothetical protein
MRVPIAVPALLLLLWLWRPALRAAAQPTVTQSLETRVAARVGTVPLPADALIIAAQPTVLAAMGMPRVMQTAVALDDLQRLATRVEQGEASYFFCDMYCEGDLAGADGASRCQRIFARFAATAVAEETLDRRTYGLYRLTGPASATAAPPPCPLPP